MRWHLIAARWALDEIRSDEAPKIATEALVEGRDSPPWRTLAGERDCTSATISALFEEALSLEGVTIPDKASAVSTLARHVADLIVSRNLHPLEGARRLARLGEQLDPSPASLVVFSGLESQYQDFSSEPQLAYYGTARCEQTRRETLERIVLEAENLISSPPEMPDAVGGAAG